MFQVGQVAVSFHSPTPTIRRCPDMYMPSLSNLHILSMMQAEPADIAMWVSAVFAVLAFLAAAATFTIQLLDRTVRLEVGEVNYLDEDRQMIAADNESPLDRFLLHNKGAKAIDIRDVRADTAPNRMRLFTWMGLFRGEGTIAVSMRVVEGPEIPGWFRPGQTLRLDAYEGARALRRRGATGELKTDIIVVDVLEKERRYPITLYIRE